MPMGQECQHVSVSLEELQPKMATNHKPTNSPTHPPQWTPLNLLLPHSLHPPFLHPSAGFPVHYVHKRCQVCLVSPGALCAQAREKHTVRYCIVLNTCAQQCPQECKVDCTPECIKILLCAQVFTVPVCRQHKSSLQ